MKVHRDIRALLNETTPVDPGRTLEEDKARVALPGDPVEVTHNPYASRNPQGLLRLLRSGSLDPDEESQIRQALVMFEGFSGERLIGGMDRPAKKPPPAPEEALPDVVENLDRVPELENVFRSWNKEG